MTSSVAQPRLRTADRFQVDPDPLPLDQLLPADDSARLVWQLVCDLDFEPLYQQIKAVEHRPGRPPTDPKILTALWIQATIDKVSSARRLDELCWFHDRYKWIRGGVSVNYHTLADFRVDHLDWLKSQFIEIVAALMEQGLVELEQVGQDGMRVRASAGASSFYKEAKLEEALQQARQHWQALEQQQQNEAVDVSPAQQSARERAARERLERLEKAKLQRQKIADSREARKKGDGAQASASSTDPDARKMKMADGGTRPAYNVQFATTLDSLVIVGVEVSDAGADSTQLIPMIDQLEADYQELPEEMIVDGGFVSKEGITQAEKRGITLYAPVTASKRQLEEGKDPYAPRKGDSEEVKRWRARMGSEQGRQKYKRRGVCEWTNAMCRNRGLWQFVVRGLEKVSAVVMWYVLAHNLLRGVALRAQQG